MSWSGCTPSDGPWGTFKYRMGLMEAKIENMCL
jgi:hypothetical protein